MPVLAFRPAPPPTSVAPPWHCTRVSSSGLGRLVGALRPSTKPATPPRPHQRHRRRQHHRPRQPTPPRPRLPRPLVFLATWRPPTADPASAAAHGAQRRWGSPPATEAPTMSGGRSTTMTGAWGG